MSLDGSSGAAFGDQSAACNCRLGYVVGPTSSTIGGPRRIRQWTSKSTRKFAKSSLGGGSYAFSGAADHMSL